ncbi:MAG: hypothetical protein FWC32_03450 [Firmicutes bacterium]|nr:hypothetical protein [Bacillota bacterium]
MKKIFACSLFIIMLVLGHVHALPESFDAVPSNTQILLNSEPFVIEGFLINEQMYFSMGEIARMLHGTRARFILIRWSLTSASMALMWHEIFLVPALRCLQKAGRMIFAK